MEGLHLHRAQSGQHEHQVLVTFEQAPISFEYLRNAAQLG